MNPVYQADTDISFLTDIPTQAYAAVFWNVTLTKKHCCGG